MVRACIQNTAISYVNMAQSLEFSGLQHSKIFSPRS